jgi:hypothetical protein
MFLTLFQAQMLIGVLLLLCATVLYVSVKKKALKKRPDLYVFGAMLLAVACLSLTGCGKTVDQIVKTGQDLIGIAGETYKDVKENVDTAKKLVVPADPSKVSP